jgi:hypothetical protein
LWKALLLEATGATAATTEHQRNNHSHIFSRAFQRELNRTTTIQRRKKKTKTTKPSHLNLFCKTKTDSRGLKTNPENYKKLQMSELAKQTPTNKQTYIQTNKLLELQETAKL